MPPGHEDRRRTAVFPLAATLRHAVHVAVDEKIAAVMRQLDRGEAVIVFDPETATVDIVAATPSRRTARPAVVKVSRRPVRCG